jgi:hypothetical protein
VILLSHVRCFFCGKDSAISSFDPSELDLDIYTRQVYGLGYKRGFAFGPDVSVLGDDEFTPKFKDRSIEFIRLLMERGIITPIEVQKQLKIGVPIYGTDDVIPYEDFCRLSNDIMAREVSKLKKEVSLLRSSASSSSYYKNMYDDLVDSDNKKKRVEKILIWLYNNLESEIFIEKGEWMLHIKEYNLDVAIILCKHLYKLNREENELLEKRIVTDCVRAQAYTKRLSDFYYHLNNLPTPESLENNIFS